MGLTGFNRVRRMEAEKAAAVKPVAPSPTPALPPVVETAVLTVPAQQEPINGVLALEEDQASKKPRRRRKPRATEGII